MGDCERFIVRLVTASTNFVVRASRGSWARPGAPAWDSATGPLRRERAINRGEFFVVRFLGVLQGEVLRYRGTLLRGHVQMRSFLARFAAPD
jgi:hypothetical protein